MVFTDPPYNVPIQGHVMGSGAIKHQELAMASGEMTSHVFAKFLKDVFRLLSDHSNDGSIHFVCMDWRHMNEILQTGQETVTLMPDPDFTEPIDDKRYLEALYRQDLAAFTERCFYEINPGQTFAYNWNFDAIAYQLGQVAQGNIRRLLISLPPRSLKSLSASIAFPAWLLGRDPSRRIVCVSYASDLAITHANRCRQILSAPWFKHLFPRMRIDPRKDTETEVKTAMGGYRLTTTVGGSLTGRGGSIFVIDDPMKAADANSEAARTRVNTWYDQTLLTRLDSKANDAIIIVMQCLHVDDLAGHILQSGEWTHLNLPAISEIEVRIQTGPDQFHYRPVDDVLHPEREPRLILDDLKQTMGSASFSAQYQQQPIPAGGHMVNWEWFSRYSDLPPARSGDRIVQSWDTASKAHQLADYSVGITPASARMKSISSTLSASASITPVSKKVLSRNIVTGIQIPFL